MKKMIAGDMPQGKVKPTKKPTQPKINKGPDYYGMASKRGKK